MSHYSFLRSVHSWRCNTSLIRVLAISSVARDPSKWPIVVLRFEKTFRNADGHHHEPLRQLRRRRRRASRRLRSSALRRRTPGRGAHARLCARRTDPHRARRIPVRMGSAVRVARLRELGGQPELAHLRVGPAHGRHDLARRRRHAGASDERHGPDRALRRRRWRDAARVVVDRGRARLSVRRAVARCRRLREPQLAARHVRGGR